MAICGIKKYDELPAVVGMIDVDYLRYRLYRCNNPIIRSKIPILSILISIFTPPSDSKTKEKIIIELERAYKRAYKIEK